MANDGVKTVLFGDSLTDFWEYSPFVTATYDQLTGIVTFTYIGHGLWTGAIGRFWCFTYPETAKARRLPLTRVNANTLTMTLADQPTLAPTLTGSVFLKAGGVNQYISWVGMMQMRLGHPLDIIANSAQNGDITVNALARLETDVFAYNPQMVLMQSSGINDLKATYGGAPYSGPEVIADITQLFDAILNRGIQLVVGLISPLAAGEPHANKAQMQRVLNINKAIVAYGRSHANIFVIDSYSRVISPADPTGLAVTSYLHPTDHIHYSAIGAARVASPFETLFTSLFPSPVSTLPQTVLDYQEGSKLAVGVCSASGGIVTVNSTAHGWKVGEAFYVGRATPALANGAFTVSTSSTNSFTYAAPGIADGNLGGIITISQNNNLFANPLLITATGGNLVTGSGNNITGVAASNISVYNAAGTGSITGVGSVAPAASGFGNEQVFTVTACAANDRIGISSYGTTAFALRMVNGRLYQFEARLRINSSSWVDTPVSEIFARLDIAWSTGEFYYMLITGAWDGLTTASIEADQSWHLKSSPISTAPPQAGSTITAANWILYVRTSAAITNSKTLTVGLSQPAFRDVGAA